METDRQDDFSAGVVDIDRAGVQPGSVFGAENVILDGEAALRRRGATRAFGSDRADAVWVWHGVLAGGRRTVAWDTTDGFCVLADDSNGLPGSPIASTAYGSGFHGVSPGSITAPPPYATLGGILFVAPRVMYAGSRKSAAYSAPSTTFTLNSATVTKAAGGFTANVDAGMLVLAAANARYYVVKSVESDTSLTLTEPYTLSTATGTAAFTPVGDFTTTVWAGVASPTFSLVAAIANRLVIVPSSGAYTGKAIFSNAAHPTTGAIRWHTFEPQNGDLHEPPAGSELKALANLRDRLFMFTSEGVYVVSNMAYEVVDFAGNPQQRVELYTKDVRVLSQASIVAWKDSLLVPAFDDIVLLDGLSAPVAISRGAQRAWRAAVAVATPGQGVVFANHLVQPLGGELWLFKLDAPVPDDDGPIFPFVKWNGGAIVGTSALALRPVSASALPGGSRVLAANASITGIFDLLLCFLGETVVTSVFAVAKADHAGAADTYIVRITTRDFALGDAREGLLRRVQAWYTLSGLVNGTSASGVNGVELTVLTGGSRALGSGSAEATAGAASTGTTPTGWTVTKQAERVRLEIELGGDCTEFVLHGLQLAYRTSQRAY